MALINNEDYVEFGVWKITRHGIEAVQIPADHDVQGLLKEMLESSIKLLGPNDEIPAFDFAQTYSADQRASFSIDDAAVEQLAILFRNDNLPIDAAILADATDIKCYFATLFDNNNHKVMIGLKRAGQFKIVSKARNRLVRLVDDTVKPLTEPVFKFDADFDVIIRQDTVLVVRPQQLRYIIDLDQYIISQSGKAVEQMESILPFLDCKNLNDLVEKKRAGALMTAISRRADLSRISQTLLEKECLRCKLPLETDENGKLKIPSGRELQFLKILDRRLYAVSLIDDEDEIYEAENRHPASVPTG